ncbi:MAG: methyl-accepting chemotaxis protein [Wujia sp.]
MNEKLSALIELLPIIHDMAGENSYISVIDAEGIVQGYAIPAGEQPAMHVGTAFKDPSGAMDEVLATGMKKHNFLPEEVMGVAFEGVLVPIKEYGKVVGIITCTQPAADKERIREATNEFKQSIESIEESITEVVNGFENIFGTLKDMEDKTTEVEGNVKSAATIVNKIKGNANHSNILALNASIEAARSGEAGRGFSVVASQMGKLSNDSGSSAKEIDSALNTITKTLKAITEQIGQTNTEAGEYLGSINEVKETLEKTLALANELEKSLLQ